MEIDKEDIKEDQDLIEIKYKRKSIYIIHYGEDELRVSYGIINDIINGKINHFCNIEEGLFGSLLLSLENNKIIGIQCGDSTKKINFGIFIKNVIDEFNNNEYKNEINLIYHNDISENITRIFGEKFVENNKNNIELIINGIESKLIERYK